ncbi:murein L,D-transpeptidase family protein [Helicobacter sp. MIT 14-3879]|uniref:L,D-transpeptidase family protein n=1 Tax=Helicobacter sp. MIT 14-3879 TaxID=2040649 RepID=UPI000E1F2918|nr:L,D-transpeptidase family protein [Helicobacter sp. MIT 14-3879]RDU65448.1 peptidase [Helicobacter sp. MIT 14-3879]
MKYLALLLLAITMQANDTKIYDIVNIYQKNGIGSIKNALEKYLMDKSYWQYVLKNKDTKLGYYESIDYIFIASKLKTSLELYKLEDDKLKLVNKTSAIFGSNKEDKKTEGDLATPIGVYDLTKKLQNLDQYYGPLAFATSYPNLHDKLNKKTGYGIWIHGLPLNGNRDNNTKGCIAIENNILIDYDKIIDHKKTILITSSTEVKEVKKDSLASILQSLFIWRDAWINNDLGLYLSFYDDNFIRFDGMRLKDFKEFKKRVFTKDELKTIDFKEINISPYPNEDKKDMYRITFLEDYMADGGYKFKGIKELYIVLNNDKMKIIIEK